METTPEKYQQYVRQKQKKSPLAKDLALAFLIGGLICVVGQLIQDGYAAAGLEQEDAATATSISLVFLSALLTGLNLYHRIARFGGAGTLVASLASLITFCEYTKRLPQESGRFLLRFSAVSFALLAILLAAMALLGC